MNYINLQSGGLEWWFPFLKKGTGGCAPISSESHHSAFLGKFSLGCWRGGFGRLLNPGRLRKNSLVLDLAVGWWTSSSPSSGAVWEFAHRCACALWIWKRVMTVPQGVLWEALSEYGILCETAGMKIIISKSKSMVLSFKSLASPKPRTSSISRFCEQVTE